MMLAVCTSETSVYFNGTRGRYPPEGYYLLTESGQRLFPTALRLQKGIPLVHWTGGLESRGCFGRSREEKIPCSHGNKNSVLQLEITCFHDNTNV
jgi:hypothetical protein